MSEKQNILVTGGAGFIGSNIVEALLNDERVGIVRVLDSFVTGFKKNLVEFHSNERFELIEGDITDFDTCLKACKGINLITHQAALGSVPRSIVSPLITNDVNITGTLNIFQAAVKMRVKRVVFAASSSTYGDSKGLPKVEHTIGRPLSPYAVTKYVNELYADVFSKTYDFEFIGLRYFNIFGPKQDPGGSYAAVIPLFYKAALENKSPAINGDGSYSRDFTYVDNAVQANLRGLFTKNEAAVNQIYNIACGDRTTLLELWESIKEISGTTVDVKHRENRIGDVPHSLADISKAKSLLGYVPVVNVRQGLENSHNWYTKIYSSSDKN